jgi:hypothetical protein
MIHSQDALVANRAVFRAKRSQNGASVTEAVGKPFLFKVRKKPTTENGKVRGDQG